MYCRDAEASRWQGHALAERCQRRAQVPGEIIMKSFRRIGALQVVGLVGVLAIVIPPAMRAQQPPGPLPQMIPVTASTVARNPDHYYGKNVSLSGVVDQRLSTSIFLVDQDPAKGSAQNVLILTQRIIGSIDANTYVSVVGHVVPFDAADIAAKNKTYPLDLPAEVVSKYQGRPAILATAVINAAGIDVTKRLPSAMTAQEQSYAGTMRKVAPAFNALRQAIDGSHADAAAEQIAVLKQTLGQTEAFWKTQNKTEPMQFAHTAQEQVDAIQGAVLLGKWDQAKTTATALNSTCQTCHTAYRERFDDGSFRIKAGS